MTSMNQLLDEHYGTSKTAAAASSDESEKAAEAAHVQLFLKLASENGIDVNTLAATPEGQQQVNALWENFQKHAAAQEEFEAAKTASAPVAPAPTEKVATDLGAQADEELQEKKAAARKLAEADFLGRVMAHSYAQELHLMKEGGAINKEAAAIAQSKVAEFPFAKKDDDKKDESKGEEPKKDEKKEEAKEEKKEAGAADLARRGLGDKARSAAHAVKSHLKEHSGKYIAGAGGAAAGAAASHAGKSKKASAIDTLAAELAVVKVAQWTESLEGATPESIATAVEEAAEKLAAAETLGLFQESTKIASAPDRDAAIDWRACELLETVGYPITWPE